MVVKLASALGLCALLIGGQVFAEVPDCVLPVADGGVENPSPPSAQGVIDSVESGRITVKGKEDTHVLISEETQLFTVYGGIVFPREIKKGQHVLVWFVGCNASQKSVAAVIELCSKGIEPCPK
jgi:hypothetical protein